MTRDVYWLRRHWFVFFYFRDYLWSVHVLVILNLAGIVKSLNLLRNRWINSIVQRIVGQNGLERLHGLRRLPAALRRLFVALLESSDIDWRLVFVSWHGWLLGQFLHVSIVRRQLKSVNLLVDKVNTGSSRLCTTYIQLALRLGLLSPYDDYAGLLCLLVWGRFDFLARGGLFDWWSLWDDYICILLVASNGSAVDYFVQCFILLHPILDNINFLVELLSSIALVNRNLGYRRTDKRHTALLGGLSKFGCHHVFLGWLALLRGFPPRFSLVEVFSLGILRRSSQF